MLAAILFGIAFFLLLYPVFARAFAVNLRHHTQEIVALKQRIAAHDKADEEDKNFFAEWHERIGLGYCLCFITDKKVELLRGDTVFENDRKTIAYYPLREDVAEWCRVSLNGHWSVVPLNSKFPIAAVWFEIASDAVAFKLRWY